MVFTINFTVLVGSIILGISCNIWFKLWLFLTFLQYLCCFCTSWTILIYLFGIGSFYHVSSHYMPASSCLLFSILLILQSNLDRLQTFFEKMFKLLVIMSDMCHFVIIFSHQKHYVWLIFHYMRIVLCFNLQKIFKSIQTLASHSWN